MDQQIRFCKTSDGVRIAYAATGAGPPLVRLLGWFTHLEFEWQNLIWRHFIGGLSARHFPHGLRYSLAKLWLTKARS